MSQLTAAAARVELEELEAQEAQEAQTASINRSGPIGMSRAKMALVRWGQGCISGLSETTNKPMVHQ